MAQRSRQVADERRRLRALRRALSGQERRVAERRITATLRRMGCTARGRRVALYLARDGEVDLAELIRAARRGGARLYAPHITSQRRRAMRFLPLPEDRALRRNWYGIDEPEHQPALGIAPGRPRHRPDAAGRLRPSWPPPRHGGGLLRPRASAAARRRRRVATTAHRRRRLRLPGDRHDRGGALGRPARPGRDGTRRVATATRIRPTHGVNAVKYWLFKTEPSTFGVDHLARARNATTAWDGVRNYQARNMLRDDMQKGDLGFLYHSSCDEPGIAGIVRVVRAGYPEAAALDPKTCLLRSGKRSEAAALVQRRHQPRAAHRPADHARNLAQTCASEPQGHGDTAKRQPALGDAGERPGVEVHTHARVRKYLDFQCERHIDDRKRQMPRARIAETQRRDP